MTSLRSLCPALLWLLLATPALAGGLRCAVNAALDGGPGAEATLAALRRAGYRGIDNLAAALEQRHGALDRLPASEAALLDRVCGMRDCAAARLYWFTDLAAALEVARREGKPVLSLRLLGRLDEEMSCANSRFFRTALYPDRSIGRLLREEFILHWRSVRPVPRVTIDFGDGRTLEAPVTGNSIHYVLDPGGRLVEAIPGLFGPRAFLELLRDSVAAVRESHALDDDAFALWAAARSRRVLVGLEQQLESDYRRLAELRHAASQAEARPSDEEAWKVLGRLPAELAEPLRADVNTMTKSSLEVSLVAAFRRPAEVRGPWNDLAPVYLAAARLDAASRRFALRKHGVDDPERGRTLLAAFEADLARDTVLNQYRFRYTLHRWLAAEPVLAAVEAFNEHVYAELFDAPMADPWMGFSRDDIYAGLEDRGRIAGR